MYLELVDALGGEEAVVLLAVHGHAQRRRHGARAENHTRHKDHRKSGIQHLCGYAKPEEREIRSWSGHKKLIF